MTVLWPSHEPTPLVKLRLAAGAALATSSGDLLFGLADGSVVSLRSGDSETSPILESNGAPIGALAEAADAVVALDENGTLRRRDRLGTEVECSIPHVIHAMAIHPYAHFAALAVGPVGARDHTLLIWDVRGQFVISHLDLKGGPNDGCVLVNDLAFTKDGRFLVATARGSRYGIDGNSLSGTDIRVSAWECSKLERWLIQDIAQVDRPGHQTPIALAIDENGGFFTHGQKLALPTQSTPYKRGEGADWFGMPEPEMVAASADGKWTLCAGKYRVSVDPAEPDDGPEVKFDGGAMPTFVLWDSFAKRFVFGVMDGRVFTWGFSPAPDSVQWLAAQKAKG